MTVAKVLALHKFICAAGQAPSFLQTANTNCRIAQVVAYSIASNLPSATTSLQAFVTKQVCSDGLAALWVSEVYLEILLILVLPVGCTYILELKAKRAFAASKGLRMQCLWTLMSWAGLAYFKAAMAVMLLAVGWIFVEHAYTVLQPSIECYPVECKR
jgi:hypothetical protein